MTNEGHGHVFRRADGQRTRCGGPGLCVDCTVDLERLAASAMPKPADPVFETALEAELQQMCDRALEGT